jgi:hypothetical protein
MKMENMQMVSRSLGILAVMVFALQSVGQAGAACQNVEGAVCGGGGTGLISSVTGNVSLAQGGGVLKATSGASVSPGARILAGEGGTAQVNLGAGCFTSVAPNSVATFTSHNGVTCLRQNDRFTAQEDHDHDHGFDGRLIGFGALGLVGLIGIIGVIEEHHHSGPPPVSN